jgi:hypothetical protein
MHVIALVKLHTMALCAKLSIGLDAQEQCMLGPMRVMAQDAHPHLHRLVDQPRLGKAVVARKTQFRIVTGSFEFVPRPGFMGGGALLGFVTSIALVLRGRLVDTLAPLHLQMTIRRGTRRPVGRGRHRSPTCRLLGRAGCDRSRRDENTDHHAQRASHEPSAELERSPFIAGNALTVARATTPNAACPEPGNLDRRVNLVAG